VSEKAAADIQTTRELAARDTAVAGAAALLVAVALIAALVVLLTAGAAALELALLAVAATVALLTVEAVTVGAPLDVVAAPADTVPVVALPAVPLPPQALSNASAATGSMPERTRRRLNRPPEGWNVEGIEDPFLTGRQRNASCRRRIQLGRRLRRPIALSWSRPGRLSKW